MLTHRGFSAWIVVDGKELPEYLVAVDGDPNRVSCWIPGEEGQVSQVKSHSCLSLLFPLAIFNTLEGPWRKGGHLRLHYS
jgi:hypothetical protein